MLGVIWILLVGLSPKAMAWTEVEIRSVIEENLKLRHPTETADWWRSLGSQTPHVMIAMIEEEKRSTYQKIRLMDSLAWFNEPQVINYLKRQSDENPNSVIKRSAIRAIGLSQGIKEKQFLQHKLESADSQTRFSTAQVLSHLKDPIADQMLRDFLKKEKASWITNRLSELMTKERKK